ncbi:serine/threonine-protein kinase pdik1l-B-like [Anneissia japonica]|uniref:serine/threonine-protein kinase pdik1l-B-like n=1 Tax=Anneissia japonica TaxID=1529436 RepID=UPI0014259EB6|nr:serine/threonine-protein kinase pdik1l-B-like [Anneissia japonica]
MIKIFSNMGTGTSYAIQNKLGEGMCGEVYKAWDKNSRTSWAIKTLKRSNFNSLKELKSEAMKEIDALLKVKHHENVVNLKEYFQKGKHFCLVMELCRGGTLNDFILQRSKDSVTNLRFMKQLSSGVAFLHEQGVVHRDLKPDNILIEFNNLGEPVVKISDFGLAKVFLETFNPSAQEKCISRKYMRTCCGTPFFQAPETQSFHYTHKADIFSLGAIFAAMMLKQKVQINTSQVGVKRDLLVVCMGNLTVADYEIFFNMDYHLPADLWINPQLTLLLNSLLRKDYHERPGAYQLQCAIDKMSDKDVETDIWREIARKIEEADERMIKKDRKRQRKQRRLNNWKKCTIL